jgi:cytidylate kinase
MQKLFGIDRTDPSLYTVVLNTARVPLKECVEHGASFSTEVSDHCRLRSGFRYLANLRLVV